MKYIDRNHSVLTGKKNLEPLHTFHHFPIFIGSTDQKMEDDLFADLSLAICPETGVIQLDRVLPLDLIYSGYHSEALGGVWAEHHTEFIAFIQKYKLTQVLEIGGSDGRLAKEYIRDNKTIRWSIVEPNPVIFAHDQITFINHLFDSAFELHQDIDGIIHSHTLEHMYEPREFLQTVSKLLKPGQHHLFSVPNLYAYLQNKYTNILNFEHTIFLTEYLIDYLLSIYNLEIIEKKYFHDHSIFYATKKTDKNIPFIFKSKYEEYKKMYLDYVMENQQMIEDLNKKISEYKGDVYLFGAHVFSQFLLNQGLRINSVKGILDNSRIKQGKRLYGTPFKILSPEVLKMKNNNAVILKAGAYQDEIKKQLRDICPDVMIWE